MIICSKCKKMLDPINPAVQEKKLCIDCVRGQAPAADISKLVDSKGQRIEPKMSINDYKRFMKKFQNMSLEHSYVEISGKIHLELKILDYHKNIFMKFAFGKGQLDDFITDINTIENATPEDKV